MAQFTALYNYLLAIFTVGLQLGLVVFLVLFLFLRKESGEFFKFISEKATWIIFVITSSGIIGSLIYSDVIGYVPCGLCWWERIFMYPQAFIAAVALIKKRDDAHAYVLPIAIAGAIIAAYHSYIQYAGVSFIKCDASGVSCIQRYVFELGFVTIPLMALTGFLAIIFVLVVKKYYKAPNSAN